MILFFECSFILLLLLLLLLLLFCQKKKKKKKKKKKTHLIVTFDVIICTGYIIFAHNLNLCVYIFRNNSKK